MDTHGELWFIRKTRTHMCACRHAHTDRQRRKRAEHASLRVPRRGRVYIRACLCLEHRRKAT